MFSEEEPDVGGGGSEDVVDDREDDLEMGVQLPVDEGDMLALMDSDSARSR